MDLHRAYKERCRLLVKVGLAYEELENYNNFKDLMSEEVFKVIIKDKHNRSNKRYRTKKKLKEMIYLFNSIKCENKRLVFGTCTLDKYYIGLKENTYIREIHKWLKKHFIICLLNKDFGEKKGREHYHFIGITGEEIEQKYNDNGKPLKSKKGYLIYELKEKDYKIGFEPTLCIIDLNKNDLDKTINYLLKLNNHSNKFLTKGRLRVIKSPLFKVAYEEREEK